MSGPSPFNWTFIRRDLRRLAGQDSPINGLLPQLDLHFTSPIRLMQIRSNVGEIS
jgi:hypothetical protein